MELEYKWQIPQQSLAALAKKLHETEIRRVHRTLHMQAIYYDTPDSQVYKNGAALRIRRENDKSVCCMKRTVKKDGARALREEYEVEAETLKEGLARLPDAGAPRDLCLFLAAQDFLELGRTDFMRNCYLLEIDECFTAELAVDVGSLGGAAHMQPFEELELEFKAGDSAAFSAYAEALAAEFSLIPQPLSKLARAIAAAKKE